jgi:hypothetical protein
MRVIGRKNRAERRLTGRPADVVVQVVRFPAARKWYDARCLYRELSGGIVLFGLLDYLPKRR